MSSLSAIVESTAAHLREALPTVDARREAEALVLRCLQLPRSVLFLQERELSTAEQERVLQWRRRRAAGEPLAYLCGEREFWSLPLQVDARVLVPRPETELLVERALQIGATRATHDRFRVLDLGTGSGAIALAIAHERRRWLVTATDRSPAALELARHNAARLNLTGLEFLEGEWFSPLGGRQFELVLANPPYVAADDPLLQGDSLRYEPIEALTPGMDALGDLRRIIAAAPTHLVAGGALLLEHGTSQGAAVRELLQTHGFERVHTQRDLAGHERLSEGWRS